jgi:putative hydrolase of the HAD superfamily
LKKYTHLFFDLDRTLWDYDTNATETLQELIYRYGIINGYPVDSSKFVTEFFRINEDLWSRFDQGLIDKNYIRAHRFPFVLKELGISNFNKVEQLQDDFIRECPTKGNLIDGAKGIIDKLSKHYPLYIITNGFMEIQDTKLRYSGLEGYFEKIITSELAGIQKPDQKIFKYALKQAEATEGRSLMIGDNFDSDILGARNSGIDQVYFNPEKKDASFKPTYEIKELQQLVNILL